MNDFSEVIKNGQQIKDLFQKLKRRKERIEFKDNQNKVKYFRTSKVNQIDLMRKRKNLDLEIIQIEKKGIKANFNDGAVKRKKLMGTPKEREPQQTKNFRVGFGKYDLDTGLNEKMKRGARKEKQSKSLNIYKQTYQDLQE